MHKGLPTEGCEYSYILPSTPTQIALTQIANAADTAVQARWLRQQNEKMRAGDAWEDVCLRKDREECAEQGL